MGSLHRQFGIVNFEPLRPIFMKIYFASFAQHPSLPTVGHLRCPLHRDSGDNQFKLPDLCVSLQTSMDLQKQALTCYDKGQLAKCIEHFQAMLHHIPFAPITTKEQLAEARSMIATAKEYISVSRIKQEAAKKEKGSKDYLELICLATRYDQLQPQHI